MLLLTTTTTTIFSVVGMYGKNGFPTYCTHDFFYWSLEKSIKFGYFQFSIIIIIKKWNQNCSVFVTIERQFCL
jgi:hypothetical protein